MYSPFSSKAERGRPKLRLAFSILALSLTSLAASFAGEGQVNSIELCSPGGVQKDIRILSASLSLPEGNWGIEGFGSEGVMEPFLIPVEYPEPRGKLARAIVQREMTQKTRNQFFQLSSLSHNIRSLKSKPLPEAKEGVDVEAQVLRRAKTIESYKKRFNRLLKEHPLNSMLDEELPFAYQVHDFDEWQRLTEAKSKEVVLIELHPIDLNGRHYVLLANGQNQRRELSAEELQKYGIEAHVVKLSGVIKDESATQTHYESSFCAKLSKDFDLGQSLNLLLKRHGSDERLSLSLELGQAKLVVGKSKGLQTWMDMRFHQWEEQAALASSSAATIWAMQSKELYPNVEGRSFNRIRNQNRGRSTSLLNVLGGRAAIRETLQMRGLAVSKQAMERSIPIHEIPGVEVEAHPYREMLGELEVKALELACLIPADRFFAYTPQPKALFDGSQAAQNFMHKISKLYNSSAIEYDIEEKLLARIGLTKDLLRQLMTGGLVTELAVSMPDLFLIDGTDVSCALRIARIQSLQNFLKVFGLSDLGPYPKAVQHQSGSTSYWALVGNILLVSTSSNELEQMLALHEVKGNGSLGLSAEFLYMQTQLAVTNSSLGYVYFSDPFIRRLTGPEVKIGQLRRQIVRSNLEMITSAYLLCLADGNPAGASVEELMELKYLPADFDAEGYSVDWKGLATSVEYGTINSLKTLTQMHIGLVTEAEAKAYKNYRDNYSQFWRQFFDPIAIRLSQDANQRFELETFILPLIDSSIYESVREFLASASSKQELSVPILSPAPVLQFSLRLNDEAWSKIAFEFSRNLKNMGFPGVIATGLGQSVHFSIMDDDPVLNLGSGDLFGAFGGDLSRNEEMLSIPVLLTALTRPCKLHIEISDKAALKDALHRACGRRIKERGFFGVSYELVEVEEGNEWLLAVDLGGILKMRYGIRILGPYLEVSNIPWSQSSEIVGYHSRTSTMLSLGVAPGQALKQLAALHSSAMETQRAAAFKNAAYLQPIVDAFKIGPAEAQDAHMMLYGFRPRNLGIDRFEDRHGRIYSSKFGFNWKPKHVFLKNDPEPFGVLHQVKDFRVGLQMEGEGLRTKVSWSLR